MTPLVELGQGREWQMSAGQEESAGWAVIGVAVCLLGMAMGLASLWIWPAW